MSRIATFAATTIAALAAVSGAHAATLYSNDFEGASTADLTGATQIIDAPNGSTHFLGPLSTANGTGSVILTLNTAGYSSLTLNYDAYAIMTVDGDGPAGGNTPANPDAFIVGVAGGPTLENYSFANYPGDTQNYPGNQQPATAGEPDQTGAAAVNTLGYGNSGDATYAFSYTFAPTGNVTKITFTGQDNQDVGDEYFGLDNILVTGVPTTTSPAVPEPATWTMMLIGLFGLGWISRAHRKSDRQPRALEA